MAKVYVFLADGFEDIEALAPIDILRRGGMDVVTVSVMDYQLVESAHGVSVMADALFDDVASFSDADLLVLPGGMPGASNLYNHEGLRRVLVDQYERQERIAAICASPGVVLAPLGILSGKRATCYPGFEQACGKPDHTVELCAFRTNKEYRGKGYFSKLMIFLQEDLKKKGYTKAVVGVEPKEKRNREIYRHWGFTEDFATGTETYPDGTVIQVEFLGKTL